MDVKKLWEAMSSREKQEIMLCVHKEDLHKTRVSTLYDMGISNRLKDKLTALQLEGYLYIDDIDRELIRSKHGTNRKMVVEFDDIYHAVVLKLT